jgi:hypothetical protein
MIQGSDKSILAEVLIGSKSRNFNWYLTSAAKNYSYALYPEARVLFLLSQITFIHLDQHLASIGASNKLAPASR